MLAPNGTTRRWTGSAVFARFFSLMRRTIVSMSSSFATGLGRSYSITSSARASSAGGMVRPIALAVLRLITSSNLVGCSTERSPGFSPFRMRPTGKLGGRSRSARRPQWCQAVPLSAANGGGPARQSVRAGLRSRRPRTGQQRLARSLIDHVLNYLSGLGGSKQKTRRSLSSVLTKNGSPLVTHIGPRLQPFSVRTSRRNLLLFLVAAPSCRRVRGVWSSSSRPRNSARVDQDCRTLPAGQTILNAVSGLLAYGCQVEKFLFAEDIFGFFGKLPINHRLVPKVVIPIHVCHCA